MKAPQVLGCSIIVLLSATIFLVNAQNHAPMPQARSAYQGRQISRAELTAREKYPDLFRKRDQPAPSNQPDPCSIFFPPSRRSVGDSFLQILSAEEMAAFLKGRGEFTSPNGTYYRDEYFAQNLETNTNSHRGYPYRLYHAVRDRLGNKLLEASIPHYRTWKKTLVPGKLFHLSVVTAIRAEDIDKLEQLLLADPEFEDIQVWAFRINRRFFEAVNSF